MCGICGIVDAEPYPASNIISMLERIHHRGPDSLGIYLDGNILDGPDSKDPALLSRRGKIMLGHARLEIVGGEAGAQPLSGCKNGLVVIHNGEIYNYKALLDLLGDHKFKSQSDSEIIVHLIEEYYRGDLLSAVRTAMPLLDGMYAFVVTNGRELVAARDPVGKKPIYFTRGKTVSFASERKALSDKNAPIRCLPPGCVLHVRNGRSRVYRYLKLERPPIDITQPEEALEAYERVFKRAVAKRVRGLDRVGVLFSGGVDSLMVSVALKKQSVNATCYCVGIDEGSDMQAARAAQAELGLKVRFKALDEALVERYLPEVIKFIELNGLIQIEAAIPMYIAAEMCAQDEQKVMFTGQAADELFAGYSWYTDVVREHGYGVLHHRMWDDISKLYIDTLEREDRMAMAHGIELRAPFLDQELMHTAMRISPRLKIRSVEDNCRKFIHRELAKRLGIPEHLAYREKSRAQDGTGIHQMLRRIARKRDGRASQKKAKLLDYGSNYRYLKDKYADDEVSAYIANITKTNRISHLASADEENYEIGVMP